ncbi:hypothetical protein RF11_14283 [Thelohanellus kitauei]|uniref:Tc1-like transposase DDE domain-containing protein n=1 Tax=Thelohanellus kitauei TaxID=669202 RepID=A0A0C2IYR4_THEKT|nr:hypothetical protein RF11_14283 [Thelohanellus kitauei]
MIANISDDRMIFVDETGINLHTNHEFGYAPSGLTPRISVPANKGINISCLVAISISGVVNFMIQDGAITGDVFRDFMRHISETNSNTSTVFIMDNARIHKARNVSTFIQESNIRIEYLPPYSPQLNPIEEYFSHLKKLIRARKTTNTTRD